MEPFDNDIFLLLMDVVQTPVCKVLYQIFQTVIPWNTLNWQFYDHHKILMVIEVFNLVIQIHTGCEGLIGGMFEWLNGQLGCSNSWSKIHMAAFLTGLMFD